MQLCGKDKELILRKNVSVIEKVLYFLMDMRIHLIEHGLYIWR